MALFKKIEDTIASLDTSTITEGRKQILQPLIDFIQQKINDKVAVRLNFICTHNSRRSHLSQVWAQSISHHLGLENVTCYSAGTEATALFPSVVDTLQVAGFDITKLSETENPLYSIRYAANEHPIIGFSKRLDSSFNPASQYAAIMTCSSADKGCPIVAGAEQRIPITFDDPKAFDGTPQQAEKYKERSLNIATEWYYVFSKISK